MAYLCKHCGWSDEAHRVIQMKWVQLPLFNPVNKKRQGYRKTLLRCKGFELNQKDFREIHRPQINHAVLMMVYDPRTGRSAIVDIGS